MRERWVLELHFRFRDRSLDLSLVRSAQGAPNWWLGEEALIGEANAAICSIGSQARLKMRGCTSGNVDEQSFNG
jgi:hypothetical protein